MNKKVDTFLNQTNTSTSIKKNELLEKLGLLYDIEYAPAIYKCKGEVISGNNKGKRISFELKNKNDIKYGSIVNIIVDGKEASVKITKFIYLEEKNIDLSKYPEEETIDDNSLLGMAWRHYKKIPISITDEEYQKILQTPQAKEILEEANQQSVSKQITSQTANNSSGIVTGLTVLAVIIFVAGLFIGLISAEESYVFLLIIWFATIINGTLLLAIARIITLLTDIKNK